MTLGTKIPELEKDREYWKELFFKQFQFTSGEVNNMYDYPLKHKKILHKIYKWTE